jgi:hypothetical protein
MAAFNHQLKRLQHPINSFDSRSALPQEEAIRESIQNFTVSSHNTNYSRSVLIFLVFIIIILKNNNIF